MKNIPYVKEYNKQGILTNPIKNSYLHSFDNRKERRKHLQKDRFYGESKNFHLTVMKSGKYLRYKQIIIDKKNIKKVIEHYLLQ